MVGFLRLIGQVSRGEDIAVHKRDGRRTLGGKPVRHIGQVHKSATPTAALAASVSLTAHPFTEAAQAAFTFSAQSLGSASLKKIVLGIAGERTAAGDHTISSVTVDGNSATLVKRQSVPTATVETSEIWEVNGITATSGDVVVTWSATMRTCSVGIYQCLNTATASYATAGSNADPMNAAISVPAGGILIGVAKNEQAGGAFTWTNLTEQYDELFFSTTGRVTGACDAFSAEQVSLSITADPSDIADNHAMALASWASA